MKRKTTRKPKAARTNRVAKIARKNIAGKNPAPAAAKPADLVDAMVAAAVLAFGLPLDPAWHGGVAFNLRLILRLAALVDEFSLPDDSEPAPVFHA
jgi:hypothetical protein